MKLKFENLPKFHQVLVGNSLRLNWNPTQNPSIRGSINHKAPSEYLEDIADIIFQYDIAITCILQYFDALELKMSDSYQHFMNSFVISNEVIENVNEFLIKTSNLTS